jgi:hypothetical protein
MDKNKLYIKYKFNNSNLENDLIISKTDSLIDIKLNVCMIEGGVNIDNYKIIMWRDKKSTIYLENDDFKSLIELYIKNYDLFCIIPKKDMLYLYPY